jgi:hypothetical protein
MSRCPTARFRPRTRGVLLLCSLLGCAHAPAAPTATPREPCAAGSRSGAQAQVRPHDLTFSVRTREDGPFDALPDELQSFSLGPWECALGPLGTHDVAPPAEPRMVRTRRLACTHKTGATVQSELRCELPPTLATEVAASYRRELALMLSGAPDLAIACEPALVERLGSGQAASPAADCPSAGTPCPSATLGSGSAVRE